MITESKHHTASGWAFLLAGTLMASPAAFAADESWTKRINIGGVVEAEFGASEAYDGTKTSDVALSTVELGIEGKLAAFFVGFEHEHGQRLCQLSL